MYETKHVVTLYKVPQELSDRDSILFNTKESRDDFFEQYPKIVYPKFKPVFPGSTIRINANFLQVNEYNILKLHYEDETVNTIRDFYCRIIDVTYISQKTTEISYIYDIYLTNSYLLNISGWEGAFDRETIDAGNDDYFYFNDNMPNLKVTEKEFVYKEDPSLEMNDFLYIVVLNRSRQPIGQIPSSGYHLLHDPISNDTAIEFKMNGIYVLCTEQGYLQVTQQLEPLEYIENVYRIPSYCRPGGTFPGSGDGYQYLWSLKDYNNNGIILTFDFSNIERKFLAKAPYNYIVFKNQGQDIIFNPCDFKNPKSIQFIMYACVNGQITYVPVDYLDSVGGNYKNSITIDKTVQIGGVLNMSNSIAMYQAEQQQLLDNRYNTQIAQEQINMNNVNNQIYQTIGNNQIKFNNQQIAANNVELALNKVLNHPITMQDKFNAWMNLDSDGSILGSIASAIAGGFQFLLSGLIGLVDKVTIALARTDIKNMSATVQNSISNSSLQMNTANTRLNMTQSKLNTQSENDIITLNKEKSIALNAQNVSNIAMSPSTILPGGYATTFDAVNNITIIGMDSTIKNRTLRYFDVLGTPTARVGKLQLSGKYYTFLQGSITKAPEGLSQNDTIGLIESITSGVRLWHENTIEEFGNFNIDNYTYVENIDYKIGDINNDGLVNNQDRQLIRNHIEGLNILSGTEFLSADINHDGRINTQDYILITQLPDWQE